MAKMIYRQDTGEILGVHIIGLHAADLIHEASNAIATGQTVEVRPVNCSVVSLNMTGSAGAPECKYLCARPAQYLRTGRAHRYLCSRGAPQQFDSGY